MASQYDNIKTAADLITEVQCHGLSQKTEDLNRAADIIGNTPVKELIRLANDIGRVNRDGEPDPMGTWSSNRPATQSTFYMIISNIWNWEEVTRFWNRHTNPEHEQLKQAQADLKTYMSRITELEKAVKQSGIDRLINELHDKDQEIKELKAKLYDLLMAQEGIG